MSTSDSPKPPDHPYGPATAADDAVAYLLRRIAADPRLAYYFGHMEALERLTRAHALATGIDPAGFHREFQAALRTEAPRCRSGECQNAEAR